MGQLLKNIAFRRNSTVLQLVVTGCTLGNAFSKKLVLGEQSPLYYHRPHTFHITKPTVFLLCFTQHIRYTSERITSIEISAKFSFKWCLGIFKKVLALIIFSTHFCHSA